MKNLLILALAAMTLAPVMAQKKPAGKPATKATTAKPMAKLDRSIKPKSGPAPKIQIAKPETFTLANGLKVFVVTNRKLPRVAYNLTVDYDPILEGEYAGYVELAGNLIGEGTTSRPKDKLNEEVDFMGANLNSDASGAFATGLKKYQDKLMELMADVVLHPAFPAEELEKLKTEQISALQAEKNEPNAISQKVVARLLYGAKHPYGEFATEESIKKVTVDKCKDFYNTYFHPEISYLAIVGDITLAEAKPLVEKYFGSWQKGNVPKSSYTSATEPKETVVAIVDRPSAVQSNVTVAHIVDLKPNNPDLIKTEVTNDILGGGSSARLFTNLREKHGWTYGSYSNFRSDKVSGQFSATANVRNAVTDSAVFELLGELDRLGKEASKNEELVLSRNSNAGSFVMSLESPQTIARFAINQARYNLPTDYYQNYLQNIASVTSEDVQSIAGKYIRPKQSYIVVVGNAAEVADKLKRFGKVMYFDENANPASGASLKPAPAGVTAQSVLGKYVDAIGGAKTVAATKDLALNYEASVQGQTLGLDQYVKAPNRMKMMLKMQGMTLMQMTTDGKKAKTKSMQGEKDMEGEELAKTLAKTSFNYEANPAAVGLTPTLAGVEKVEGKDAYKVSFAHTSGESWTNYFDVATGYKIREVSVQKTPNGPVTQTIDYDDYRDAGNGYKIPGKINMAIGPQTLPFELKKAEVNKKLADSVFEVK